MLRFSARLKSTLESYFKKCIFQSNVKFFKNYDFECTFYILKFIQHI